MTRNLTLILHEPPRGLQNIGAFFRDRVDYASFPSCRGCLLVNTAIERELVGEEATRKIRRYLDVMTHEFRICLLSAQSNGHIPPHKDCEVLSRYLTCVFEGLMVMGKTNPEQQALEAVVQTALSSITE